MTETVYEGMFRRHNLAATFDGRRKAQQAAEVLTRNLQGSAVEVMAKAADPAVQYAEMRDELEGLVASPALGTAVTKSQAEGAGGGALLLASVGLVIGSILGFLINGTPGSEMSVMRWLVTWAMVPMFAGGTLGLLAGGLLKQRYVPAPADTKAPREASPDAGLDSANETVVQIATNDYSEYEKALDLLEQLQPQRLDKFDSEGRVVATLELGDPSSN